jgi:hypothetical protein
MQDLISAVILRQNCHPHTDPIDSAYVAKSIYSKLNKVKKKEVHRMFVANSCTITFT